MERANRNRKPVMWAFGPHLSAAIQKLARTKSGGRGAGMAFVVLDTLVALVVCFFAARAAWRYLIPSRANTERGIPR